MNIQVMLLLFIAGLVFIDAIMTYMTFKHTEGELTDLKEKVLINERDLNDFTPRLNAHLDRFSSRSEDIDRKLREMRSELTGIHLKLTEKNDIKAKKANNETKA